MSSSSKRSATAKARISPTRQAASKRRKESNQEAGEDESQSTCEQCVEYDIPRILWAWQQTPRGERSVAVVQRLAFAEQGFTEDCPSCAELQRAYKSWTLEPSEISRVGPPLPQDAKLLPCSSFHFTAPRVLVRTTSRFDRDEFASGTFDRHGEGFWRRETFDPNGSIVGPQVDFKLLKGWLDTCAADHEKCQPQSTSALGRIRLLDVRSGRLVSFNSLEESGRDYIALSYVWGGAEQIPTREEHALNSLPQTIKDSVAVVKALGKRYLWVDSVCIDQSSHEDKTEQLGIMDIIYKCAFATIVALDSRDANSGLPGVSKGCKRLRQLVAMFGDKQAVSRLPTAEQQVELSPWARRAWTFQEGVLSQRCLLFTKHQVYFICNEKTACEATRDMRSDESAVLTEVKDPLLDPSLTTNTHRERMEVFKKVVNRYIHKILSYDSDSLNGVSALLTHLGKPLFPAGFMYGLPLAGFRSSLVWHQNPEHIAAFGTGFYRNLNKTMRRREAAIPSWSWAAWRFVKNVVEIDSGERQLSALPPLKVHTRDGQRVEVDASTKVSEEEDAEIEEDKEEEEESDDDDDEEDSDVKASDGKATADAKGKSNSRREARREMIRSATDSTETFVSRIAERAVDDATEPIDTSVLQKFHLRVEGIILNLPCSVGESSADTWAAERRPYVGELVLRDALKDGESYITWYNDGYISKIAPIASEIVDLEKPSTAVAQRSGRKTPSISRNQSLELLEKVRQQDFLLVSMDFEHDEPRLHLLHIYWEDGVATRGGVVEINLEPDSLQDFWNWCVPNARISRFWLG